LDEEISDKTVAADPLKAISDRVAAELVGWDKAVPPVLVQAPEIGIQEPSPIAARLTVLSAAVRQGLADSIAAVVDSIAEAVDSIAAEEAGPIVAAAEEGPVAAAADAAGSLRTEGEARGPR
jgi:hypothetical protein